MASNTYDFIPADRVGVLTEEAPQPSPEVLGDKNAASCVCSDILKPIASDPISPVLRYLGTRSYHAATGLELRKTYADGSSTVKTYDAFNRLSTETSARGLVATYAYETARGLLTGISYSDETPGIAYSYNHLGMLIQVTDAAGTRSLGYNTYGEAETDSLVAGEKTHLITELRDSLGRSVGYTYAKGGAVQQTVGTSYGTDGRITGAGFLHGGELKEFTYTYVSGSYLLQGITMPNNMALALSYETQRNLTTSMVYTRGTTTVVQRGYSYDALGRPLTRTQSRQGGTRNDSFTHNDRSELTAATLGTDAYAYAYDNIGNRLTAQEAAEETTAYTANNLNQYTAIQEGEAEAFAPSYDADGNQTLVKTSTGIWSVTYNAANRPVVFANEATGTVVECSYDSSGRRATKKVTVNGTVTLHQRYIYRGYLQIACCDLTRTTHPCLWLITWDPTQPIATRPLAIQKDGTWYTYGWDLTKNVTEAFTTTGYIGTAYTYTPYGEVSASGNVTQPIQWSSEYHDTEFGLVYYNYRHYNPAEGRWLRRDPMGEVGDYNIVWNDIVGRIDYLGLLAIMHCTHYADDSMSCFLYLYNGLCSCEKCRKKAGNLRNAKTKKELSMSVRKLVFCAFANQENPNSITEETIGPIYTNFGKQAEDSKIPTDYSIYRVLPKPSGGDVDKRNEKGDTVYHKGTPSPTALNKSLPGSLCGSPSDKDKSRTGIRIHQMGLSRGCITIGSELYDNSTKRYIPLVDPKTGEGYIEKVMNFHKDCGGFYLMIENSEEPVPSELSTRRRDLAEKSVYTPGIARRYGRQALVLIPSSYIRESGIDYDRFLRE